MVADYFEGADTAVPKPMSYQAGHYAFMQKYHLRYMF